jgi:hypothetical protein
VTERRHWMDLDLTDSEGAEFRYLDDKERFVGKLQEFARTGGIDGVFFASTDAPHEDPDDASTWGPRSKDEVDWTGFPVAEDGTLCRPLRVSDSGTYEPIGDIADWGEVRAAADEVIYVTGLLGWMPYTAHYAVLVDGERLHYLVADPLYGLAELARAVGWTVQKLSTYRARKGRDGKALVPKPTFETASGPVWTHGDVAEFLARARTSAGQLAALHEAQLEIRERIVHSECLRGRYVHPRSLEALRVARAYLEGQATREELLATARAARDVATGSPLERERRVYGGPLADLSPMDQSAILLVAWHAYWAAYDIAHSAIAGPVSSAIKGAAKAAYFAAIGDGLTKDDAERIGLEVEAALRVEFAR